MPIHVISYSIYHSSNCYLGLILAAEALAGLDVEVERRPLCIPKQRGLMVSDLVGGSEGRPRSSYNREDCIRWARRYGIELHLTPPEVFAARAQRWKQSPLDREELAARAYYAALGTRREADLDRALYRASYVDGLDVNEEEVVRLAARQAGLDDDELIRRAAAPATRARLDRSLAEFERDGCPGLPTWIVEGQRFWGKDRVDWLAAHVREPRRVSYLLAMASDDVAANLRRVLERIDAAAGRAARSAGEVSLVAVAKTKPAAMIDAAIAAGAAIIGENYAQEAKEKRPLVAGRAAWHLIGHLQRNKAKLALSLFDLIHTLDSPALAAVLDRLGAERGSPVRTLVEVNLGGEQSKSGVAPGDLPRFLEGLAPFAHLRVEGLMAIPPPARDDAEARAHFRALRRLRDEQAGSAPPNVTLRELSMGMTDDFEIAVEEGATLVRVGRAIFGARA